MDATVRNISSEELPRFLANLGSGIAGSPIPRDETERFAALLELERTFCVFDGDEMVGTSANFSFTLTVPGGEAGCAGITMVTVLPTHRRRGLLNQMMRRLLDDARGRGEPFAALWASEESIYQRYGFGLAANQGNVDVDRDRMRFLNDTPPEGQMRLVSLDDAMKLVPEIYERVRPRVPGMLARSEEWWREHTLADIERHRGGYGELMYGVLEREGRVVGYVLYRIKARWGNDGVTGHQLRVQELIGEDGAAELALWRFIFGVDLVTKVLAWYVPSDSILTLSVTEPRRIRWAASESFWLRLVDVAAALSARTYEPGTPVVLEVTDDYCEWNAGRYRISPTGAAPTEEEADLRVDVGALAAVYLGQFTFHDLQRALRAEELKESALRRADRLFATNRAPCCPENF